MVRLVQSGVPALAHAEHLDARNSPRVMLSDGGVAGFAEPGTRKGVQAASAAMLMHKTLSAASPDHVAQNWQGR